MPVVWNTIFVNNEVCKYFSYLIWFFLIFNKNSHICFFFNFGAQWTWQSLPHYGLQHLTAFILYFTVPVQTLLLLLLLRVLPEWGGSLTWSSNFALCLLLLLFLRSATSIFFCASNYLWTGFFFFLQDLEFPSAIHRWHR